MDLSEQRGQVYTAGLLQASVMWPSAFSGYLKLLTLGFNINRPYALHSAPKAGCEQCPLTHALYYISVELCWVWMIHPCRPICCMLRHWRPPQPFTASSHFSHFLSYCQSDTSDCSVAMRPPQIYRVRPCCFFFLPGFLLFTCMHSDNCVKNPHRQHLLAHRFLHRHF